MNQRYLKQVFFGIVAAGIFSGSAVLSFGQIGNSISGQVFGINRQPVSDVYVELRDEFSRTVSRSRTNGSGQYSFYRVPSGRFIVRVLPFGTEYEEQEQSVEITNFITPSGTGIPRILGATAEQRDFYLQLRKGSSPSAPASAVFVQEVPEQARKLFEAGAAELANKRTNEAYQRLKSALEIFPKYFAALELLGLEYVRAGHFDAARVLLLIAVDVNPRAYRSWHGLAVAANAQGSRDVARGAVEKSIEHNPSAPESLFLYGVLLRQAKEYTAAEKKLLKAKELSYGTMPDVHWELALLYANGMKRYKEASRELKSYLKARPDHKDSGNIKKLIAEFEAKAKTS